MGAGRVIGQIFAHIYLSPNPQTLDDLTRELNISKGSASMAVRQLEQWGALHRVWVKGDRKDYYEASLDFGSILRKMLADAVGRTVESTDQILEEAEDILKRNPRSAKQADDERAFMRQRIQRLRHFRNRLRQVWESSILTFLLKKK
jgi:DNA-binding transcriptional regulator GbsR (MarR family)